MLPSTDLKTSAPRTIAFSVLNSPAHPYRYRRFARPLAGTDARLAEKRGSVTPSFRGTSTPCLPPVRLAHQSRTFWIGLIFMVVAAVTVFVFIGVFVYLAALVWWTVRSVKGLNRLSKSEPYPNPNPASWLW